MTSGLALVATLTSYLARGIADFNHHYLPRHGDALDNGADDYASWRHAVTEHTGPFFSALLSVAREAGEGAVAVLGSGFRGDIGLTLLGHAVLCAPALAVILLKPGLRRMMIMLLLTLMTLVDVMNLSPPENNAANGGYDGAGELASFYGQPAFGLSCLVGCVMLVGWRMLRHGVSPAPSASGRAP